MRVTVMSKFTFLHCILSAFLFTSIWCSVVSALPAGDKSSLSEHVLSTGNLSNREINQNNTSLVRNSPAVPHKYSQLPSAKKRVEHVEQPPVLPTLKSVPVSLSSTTSASNSHHNISSVTSDGTIIYNNFPRVNSGALLRGFYVFVGLSVIVVMYLVVRSVRLRRKVSRVHKYGILASREDVEMTPLGAEDEDDDTIVFDLSSHPPP